LQQIKFVLYNTTEHYTVIVAVVATAATPTSSSHFLFNQPLFSHFTGQMPFCSHINNVKVLEAYDTIKIENK